MNLKNLVGAGALCLAFWQTATADMLVNTGTPTTGAGTTSVRLGYIYAPPPYEYIVNLSIKFTLSSAANVSGFKGFMATNQAGPLTFSLYSDNLNSPGSKLFSEKLDLTTSDYQWTGPTDLALQLPAGNYWAAFEDLADLSIWSVSSLVPDSAPTSNIVSFERISEESQGTWSSGLTKHLGLQVFGTQISPVPELPACYLLIAALPVLIQLGRKRIV